MHSRYARNLYGPKIEIIFEISGANFEIILFLHFNPNLSSVGGVFLPKVKELRIRDLYKPIFYNRIFVIPEKSWTMAAGEISATQLAIISFCQSREIINF